MTITSDASLVDPIRERASRVPDWPGLVLILEDGNREVITAGELWRHVTGTAGGLRRAGVRPSDVVLLVMGHSRQTITTFLGAMALGAVPALVSGPTPRIDLGLYRKRLEALVHDSAAAAIVINRADAAPLQETLRGSGCPLIVSDSLDGAGDEADLSPPSPEQIAFIQFSSGTGGVQKGIVHTHGAVLRYIEYKRRGHALTPDDVIVNWTPLYHDQGLVSGLLAPLVVGFRTVLMSPLQWVRQPGLLLRSMHEYGGTLCYMPNFALNHCVRATREQDSRDLDLSRWRLLLLGGEPVRVESLRAFAERFGPQGFRESAFRAGYGMAEMVEGVTASREGPPRVDWVSVAALQGEGRARPVAPHAAGGVAFVSCGPAKEGAELRIVGDAGAPLPERAVGEIEVRTESMMREYHRRPELTAAAFRDGWFRSGDLGYVAGGELHVVGRRKDLIIVGGHNVAPDEIEAVAEGVPGTLPGRVVAFGVHDGRAGTDRVILVCEAVQPDDAEKQIALERELRRATAQALDVTLGEVRVVERGWIIKTSSGKKARGENREKYLAQFRAAADAASP